jgi:membrane-associated phospholipid phosphatase
MSRGLGETAIVASLPEWSLALVALLTALGDVWFVFVLLGLLYWFGDPLPGALSLSRRRAAFAIALAFGGLALTSVLKELFRLPRPPGAEELAGAGPVPEALHPLYAEIGAATGFGFPSGHAVSAVVVYGGLALLVGSRRGYAAAGTLCVAIPLSRILLGVHYLVDVVAGVAIGSAYLFAVYRLGGRGSKPGRAMVVALGIALVGAGIAYTADTMIALGGALGARMAWGIIGDAVVAASPTRTGGAFAAMIGMGFGGLFAAIYALDLPPHVAFVGVFVVICGVLAAPLAGEAIARRL